MIKSKRFVKVNVSVAGRFLKSLRIPTTEFMPQGPSDLGLLGQPLKRWIEEAMRQTVIHCNGNGAEACRILKMTQRTFYRKVKGYGIKLGKGSGQEQLPGNADAY